MKKFHIKSDENKYVELGAPLKVYYDITTQCNLNCIFCFKGMCNSDVVWNQAKDVIKKVADANIPDIAFIGGEPMCCPFLFDALKYAKALGLNPGIITNGTLFTDENVSLLKKLVNNSISVSIHAPNNELHTEISRVEGVYSRIIEGLKILNRHEIIPELSFTPVKDNLKYLYDTISGVLKRGIQISDVLVNRLIPAGNALECWCNKQVSLDGQIVLLKQMEQLANEFPDLIITTGDAIPFCLVEEKYRKFITRCDYAITLGWINEQNLFGKCMVRGSSGTDNINNSSIRELWKNSEAFLEHRHMKNLNDDCRKCEWLFQCGGGCACSGVGNVNMDAYFSERNKYIMPKMDESYYYEQEFNDRDLAVVSTEAAYMMKNPFIIRKERDVHNEFDEFYLLLPCSSGAIIQDVIKPEEGEILWINSIEKQVILYMQQSKKIKDIAKCISYEFNISIDDAVLYARTTIANLLSLNMVDAI